MSHGHQSARAAPLTLVLSMEAGSPFQILLIQLQATTQVSLDQSGVVLSSRILQLTAPSQVITDGLVLLVKQEAEPLRSLTYTAK